MNYFTPSGNYVYHLLEHSTALLFAHKVFMCFMLLHTDHLHNSSNLSDFIKQMNYVLCEVRTEYSYT